MLRLGVLVAVLAVPMSSFAAEPKDFVKDKVTALADLFKQKAAADKVAPVLDELFDFQAMAESALGSEWASRTAEEKAQFAPLFKEYASQQIVSSLQKALSLKDVSYSAKSTLVTMKAKTKSKTAELGFTVVEANGAMKATNFFPEPKAGIVDAARSQFTKLIKKDGFPALIQKMKDKVAKD